MRYLVVCIQRQFKSLFSIEYVYIIEGGGVGVRVQATITNSH